MPGGNGFKESRVNVRKSGPAFSPTGFLNMVMDKVSKRHANQLNPWFRGTVDSYNSDGTLNVKRTGETIVDGQTYYVVGPPPPVGSDVYLNYVNGGKSVVMGGFDKTVHACRLTRSENFIVPNDDPISVPFDTALLDNTGGQMWQASAPNDMILPAPGVWALGATGHLAGGSASAWRYIGVIVSRSGTPFDEVVRAQGHVDASIVLGLTLSCTTLVGSMSAGDKVRMVVFQSGGGDLSPGLQSYDTTPFKFSPILWAYHVST